jgi:hypothetical protein
LPPNRSTVRDSKSWRRCIGIRVRNTRDSSKSIDNHLLQLPSAMPCARWCC